MRLQYCIKDYGVHEECVGMLLRQDGFEIYISLSPSAMLQMPEDAAWSRNAPQTGTMLANEENCVHHANIHSCPLALRVSAIHDKGCSRCFLILVTLTL